MSTGTDDPIETVIGAYGKYQVLMLIIITFGRYPAEFQLTNVVFLMPSPDYVCLDNDAYNMTNHCPCQQPKYDTSTIISSVTSEYNLICDRRTLASVTQSMLQVGILVGSLGFGYISDRYGRKLAVVLSLLVNAVFGTISGLVPSLWMFIVARFIIGTGLGGTMLCCFVLLVELSGKSFRPYTTAFNEISMVTGYFFLPIIANYVREWRQLQLMTSAPWLVVVIYYWVLPESPRWLITVGKKKEAVELLTFIAKINNRPIENIEAIVIEAEKQSIQQQQQQKGTYLDLFRTPNIRIRTILNAFIWMFCSHSFFGVNQYIGRLQGNIYLNVMLSAVFLILGLIFCVLASLYLKRRLSCILTFGVTALSLLILMFIPRDVQSATLTFAIIGHVGIYSAFVLIYLYSSELFPTVIRNSAMGFASMFARFGSFIAPFVVDIRVEWASLLIFSALSFMAAVLCWFLPETKGIVLLNNIEETEGREEKEKDDTIVLK